MNQNQSDENEEETNNEAIEIEQKEKSFTEDMKKYTYLVQNLIENEENNLTKLYEEFKKL